MNRTFNILAAASMATCALWLVSPAIAAPISPSLGLQNAVPTSVETVQYRRGWRGGYGYRGYGYGWPAAGFATGLALGAIASQPYYNNPYYYGGYYDPYGGPYAAAPRYAYPSPGPYYYPNYSPGRNCTAENIGRPGC